MASLNLIVTGIYAKTGSLPSSTVRSVLSTVIGKLLSLMSVALMLVAIRAVSVKREMNTGKNGCFYFENSRESDSFVVLFGIDKDWNLRQDY